MTFKSEQRLREHLENVHGELARVRGRGGEYEDA